MMGPAHALVHAFSARTGILVTYINLDGGPMQARLYAEGDRPRWTIAWFTGDAPMAALDAAGLLARHGSGDPDWPDARFTGLARSLLPRDGAWLPTRIGLGAALVSGVGAPPPRGDWQTILGGTQTLGMLSPTSSGGAYPVIATILALRSMSGRDALLAARPRLRVMASSPYLFRALRSGDVAIGLLPSETAFGIRKRDGRFAVTLPAPDSVLPDTIGVSRDADPIARAAAGRFIRFVLSPEGQTLLGRDTAAAMGWPPIDGVAPPAGLPALPGDLVRLPAAAWGARQNDEIGWFVREIAP